MPFVTIVTFLHKQLSCNVVFAQDAIVKLNVTSDAVPCHGTLRQPSQEHKRSLLQILVHHAPKRMFFEAPVPCRLWTTEELVPPLQTVHIVKLVWYFQPQMREVCFVLWANFHYILTAHS